MSNKIKTVKTEYYRVPLEGNLVDALHGKHDFFELVIAKIQLEDGRNGSGYTYTGGFGGAAIAKIIENDLTPLLVGIKNRKVGIERFKWLWCRSGTYILWWH